MSRRVSDRAACPWSLYYRRYYTAGHRAAAAAVVGENQLDACLSAIADFADLKSMWTISHPAARLVAAANRDQAMGEAAAVPARAVADRRAGCRPLAPVTSAGQRHDSLAFLPLTGQLTIARRCPGRPRTRPGRVLGDKARSSAAIRAHLRRRGITAAIPEPADQIKNRLKRGRRGGRRPSFNAAAYRRRNVVERAFCQLRQHRAVATRYDQHDYIWRGTADVASIRIWLHHPSHDLRDRL